MIGDETSQTLVLHKDGRLRLSRCAILSANEERVIESVSRNIPTEVASDIIDAVVRYACTLDIPPDNIEPWRLDIVYGSGSAKVIYGCLDSHIPDLGSTLSEFVRRRLSTAPDDPQRSPSRRAGHPLARPGPRGRHRPGAGPRGRPPPRGRRLPGNQRRGRGSPRPRQHT